MRLTGCDEGIEGKEDDRELVLKFFLPWLVFISSHMPSITVFNLTSTAEIITKIYLTACMLLMAKSTQTVIVKGGVSIFNRSSSSNGFGEVDFQYREVEHD